MSKQLFQQLAAICGPHNLITEQELMRGYTTDWRKRYHGQALAVVFPATSQEIQALLGFCQQHNIAIIAQGGNTSTCGAATPLPSYPRPQLIINLKRLNKIIAIDIANSSLLVEAGCTLQQVQDYARQNGLYFPLSLASGGSCQIGGNLATNAGGVQVLKYGMMRELTLGLEVVLPDQTLLTQLQGLRKNNCYLDLKQLFIGSEGTLGIITRANLKLFPLPTAHCTLLCGVKSLAQALSLFQHLRQEYLNALSACEIIKRDSQQIYKQHFPLAKLPLEDEWLILAEMEVSHDFNQDHLISGLAGIIELEDCLIASNDSQRKNLWQIRENIPLAEKQHGYAVKHDIALPLSQIEEFLQINMPKLLKLVPQGYFSIFGHLGDGNLHYNFGIANASLSEINQIEEPINQLVYQDVIALGGSIAAEHGIGFSKKNWLQHSCAPASYQLLQQIKQLLDPQHIFNPGKVIERKGSTQQV